MLHWVAEVTDQQRRADAASSGETTILCSDQIIGSKSYFKRLGSHLPSLVLRPSNQLLDMILLALPHSLWLV